MKKLILCILDGVGYSKKLEFNAVKLAHTPILDNLLADCPWSLLRTDGEFVGLPAGQMGNSEVGHMTIGAGRVIKQDISLISDFLYHDFTENITIQNLIKSQKTIHLISLLSDGGVHAHITHIQKILLQLVDCEIYLHLITDGRDTAPQYTVHLLDMLTPYLSDKIKIGSICGRFYAMDRDKRWDRTEKYYQLLINPTCWVDPYLHIDSSYQQGIVDEFIEPAACNNFSGIKSGSAIILMNFRADRVKQICAALGEKEFNEFNIQNRPDLLYKISLNNVSQYFSPLTIKPYVENSFGAYLSSLGMKQLRIAESEKFAHVTYFFNGGREEPFPGEDRIIIPSPKVKTYDLFPAMSSKEITTKLVQEIATEHYDFILVNFANGDMVGHTGNLPATIEAMEALDACIGTLLTIANEHNYHLVISADHGNAEEMGDNKGGSVTSHSTNPVPFIIASCQKHDFELKNYNLENGSLADIAKTIAWLMELEIPKDIEGKNLIRIIR